MKFWKKSYHICIDFLEFVAAKFNLNLAFIQLIQRFDLE